MAQARTDTGRALREVMGPLRRATTHAARGSAHAQGLSDAQIELLLRLQRHSPMTTTELAAELHLARPTVSNLVKSLDAGGMLVRELSPHDSRAVLIRLSDAARRILATADAKRSDVLQQAINRLDESDRDAIDAALPALARLLATLRHDYPQPEPLTQHTPHNQRLLL